MFERFTESARLAMVKARGESHALNHHIGGVEHILLGVLADTDGVSAQALASHGLDIRVIRSSVLEIIGAGFEPSPAMVPYASAAKEAMTLREAIALKHDYLGTEHLLLGLMREQDGVAAQVLARHGANLDAIRETIRTLAQTNQSDQTVPEKPDSGR
jgi:ATP-dependent Clp protease ATP-binding subunit ClpC